MPGVDLVDLPDFGPDHYAAVVDGEVDPFGTDHLGIEWRPKTGHVGLRRQGRLVGCAGWVPVDVAMSNRTVEAVGLGGVLVHRRFRGSGVGGPLVSGAMDRMGGLGPTLGLLFCRPQRVRFYQSLGWQVVEHTVTADQPVGLPVVMPLVTCWTALGAHGAEPTGDLHIEGLPF